MKNETYGIFSTASNRQLIKNLENRGEKVFQFPAFETDSIENGEIMSFLQTNLSEFDWLIFADVFAVDYFIEILEKCEIDLFELDEKRILVFGEAVADRLRFSQIHADVIPNSIKPDEIILALKEYLQINALEKLKFLLPKFKGFQNNFVETISKDGAEIFELEIYDLKITNEKETAKLKALLSGGAIDKFIFAAPEDVFYLSNFIFPKPLTEILEEINNFGTTEITMQTLREYGINSSYFKN